MPGKPHVVSLPGFDAELRAGARGFTCVAGVDEAGRGPLAGPVVAGAVVIAAKVELPDGLNDSKKLTPARREKLFHELLALPGVVSATGLATVSEIDSLNILKATHLAMARAVAALAVKADFCLVDGLPVKGLPCEHESIVKGDSKSLSIAAASILAKVTRDHMMEELDALYPGYGFAAHKGYGTKQHMEALRRLGPCPEHRRSFAPVAQLELPLF